MATAEGAQQETKETGIKPIPNKEGNIQNQLNATQSNTKPGNSGLLKRAPQKKGTTAEKGKSEAESGQSKAKSKDEEILELYLKQYQKEKLEKEDTLGPQAAW